MVVDQGESGGMEMVNISAHSSPEVLIQRKEKKSAVAEKRCGGGKFGNFF